MLQYLPLLSKHQQLQINEYHKLLEELKSEKIELPEQFVARLFIEKLPDSWSIEDTNRKEQKSAKAK